MELAQRTEALAVRVEKMRDLPAEALNQKADAGAWSALECLEHLNLYGDFYLKEIEERLLAAKPAPNAESYQSGMLGGYFVRIMEPKDGKIKAIKTKKPMDPAGSDLPVTTVARFLKQQQRMLELFSAAGRFHLGKVKTGVTFSSMIHLRLGDTLRFLVIHNERHVRQAEEALALVPQH